MPWDANAAEIKATAPQGLHQRASERALWVQAVSSGPPLGVGRLRTQLAALCLTGCRPQAPCFDWLPVVLSISREARGDKGRQPPPSAPAVLSAAAHEGLCLAGLRGGLREQDGTLLRET